MKEFLYKYRMPVLIISAVLTGLCVVFPVFGLLQWVSIAPGIAVLFVLSERETVRFGKMYAYGLLFFGSFYLVNYHWFAAMYPLEFLGVDKLTAVGLVAVCWIGLSLLQALTGALVFPVVWLIGRCKAVKKIRFFMPFIMASVWTVFEWTQTHGWIGVPMCRLCLGQAKHLAVLQTASLFGSYFITFLLVCVNALLAYILLNKNKIRIGAVCAAGLFVVNLLAGIFMLSSYSDQGQAVKVAGIQGNVSSLDKWSDGMRGKIFNAYDELSRDAADDGAEIIVWPESALPYAYDKNSDTHKIPSDVAVEKDVILFGGMFEQNGEERYNALYQFNPDGSVSDTRYYKRHLVPFGEYTPMKSVINTVMPFMSKFLKVELVAGEDTEIFDTEYGKIGAIICFDSIYEQLMLDSVNDGAELIILGTNDSWFFDSAAAYLHNSQASLRAIETGRYIVRAANTGYSTIIRADGKIIADTEILKEGYVISDVYFRNNRTLYSVIGNLFVYLTLAFVVAFPVSSCVSRIIENKKQNNTSNATKAIDKK